ncbi:MAG: response regulator [Rhodothermales bacterium]|nr:response regulator [Rhodothermales bacterium]
MIPLLVATLSPTGSVTHRDGAWVEVMGEDEAWARIVAEDRADAEQAVSDAAAGHVAAHVVVRAERSGEEPLPLLLHVVPVRLDGTVAAVQIVGEALVAPDALPAVRSRRQRFEAVGRMATGIAHDLNNLLAAALGHAELAASTDGFDSATADLRGHLAAIQQASADGAALVARLQQFLRQEKADVYEPVDLAALARDVHALTRPYWHHEARRRGVHIECDVDDAEVPPVLGSPVELREVAINLVLNAVHAMPQGGHLLLATGHDVRARRVRLDVSDTGIGMDEATLARIFDPLFTTKGDAGSGMGLAVARGIVEAHGGQIEVDSAAGHGTRFRLTFPALACPDEQPDAVETSAWDVSTTPSDAVPDAPPTPLRLLIVDDEARVRTVTAKLMALRGHTVVEAGSGAEALARLNADFFDVVVTDFGMPGLDGLALASRMAERWPSLPVVLLTGDTEAGRGEGWGKQVAAVVAKPFQADALEAVVRRVAKS